MTKCQVFKNKKVMENKKLQKKLQEWAEVSAIYDVCWVVYQNGVDFYVVYSHNSKLKHFVYDDGRMLDFGLEYMYSPDNNRDKVIIRELNKVIKAIREHEAYLEYLENCDCDE